MSDADQVTDPIYFTDDYPRAGCSLEIEVNEARCAFRVRAPNGRLLESYLPPREEVGRYIQEWLGGSAPRIFHADQLSINPFPVQPMERCC